MNLAGIPTEAIERGEVLTTPGWLRPSRVVDVRLRMVEDADRPLVHNAAVTFHTGAAEALGKATRKLEAEYFYPYQVHAPLETMSAVADVRRGRCEIWAGVQGPNQAQVEAAKLLGIPESAVTVHVMFLGGGFGRRGRVDFTESNAQRQMRMAATSAPRERLI